MGCDALVVDDDPDGRQAIAQLLEAHGYTVRQAENGRVALDLVAERLPCLVLLDLEMPVMSGWDVLAWLARAGALDTVAVVVLSAGASAPSGVPFVRKPCAAEELLETLGRVRGHPGASAGAEHRTGAPHGPSGR
jgi:CheY-like chemotaxis protein